MQADVHLLRCFESYETDTSAPHNLFLSPMQVSQARAERLILGGETFEMVTSEPGISEHKNPIQRTLQPPTLNPSAAGTSSRAAAAGGRSMH